MQAAIIDREKLAVGMEHRDLTTRRVDYLARAFGNLAASGRSDDLRQLVGLLR
jgi:hypothetical protein